MEWRRQMPNVTPPRRATTKYSARRSTPLRSRTIWNLGMRIMSDVRSPQQSHWNDFVTDVPNGDGSRRMGTAARPGGGPQGGQAPSS